MGSPSYSSARRIVASTMEECSALPSVLVVYRAVRGNLEVVRPMGEGNKVS